MPISKELTEDSVKLMDEIRSHQRTTSCIKTDIQIHLQTEEHESQSQTICNQWANFHRIKDKPRLLSFKQTSHDSQNPENKHNTVKI